MRTTLVAQKDHGEITVGDLGVTLTSWGERLAAHHLVEWIVNRHDGWDGMAAPIAPVPLDTHTDTIGSGSEECRIGVLPAETLQELESSLRPRDDTKLEPLVLTPNQSSTLLTLARSYMFDETHAGGHVIDPFYVTDVQKEAAGAVARNVCGLRKTVGSVALTALSKKRPPRHDATFRAYPTMLGVGTEVALGFRVSGKGPDYTIALQASRPTIL